MSKFQIILLSVFGVAILIAVMVFSLSRGSSSQSATVTVWGDISFSDFSRFINESGLTTEKNLNIVYSEKKINNFDSEFTNALAEGRGPDVILMPLEKLWKNQNKLTLIPYKSINEGDFKNTFVEEGELFLTNEGAYALPFTIDPIVLYWNRDLFTKASVSKPPVYWDEIYTYAEKLSEIDPAGNIVKSAITLGESKNIPHAKDILAMLMLQAGTPITGFISSELRPMLNVNFDLPVIPGEAALSFYTQFANPSKPFYSWNRALKSAPTAFVAGDVAMYIGYASEYRELVAKNPNLNLGVSLIPQSKVSGKAITFGNIEGLGIVRTSKNPTAALAAITKLISKDKIKVLSSITELPPVRRDLLDSKPENAIQSVFYTAALQAKGWRDPDDIKTNLLFADMIDSVTSGRARVDQAISKANREMDTYIK